MMTKEDTSDSGEAAPTSSRAIAVCVCCLMTALLRGVFDVPLTFGSAPALTRVTIDSSHILCGGPGASK